MHVLWEASCWTALLYIASARGCVCMSSGRLLIGQRCFILQVLWVMCAYQVGGSLLDSLLYIASAGGFVCMSSGRLPIGQCCFIWRVLEVLCADLVEASLLDIVALYCEC